jgi:transposase
MFIILGIQKISMAKLHFRPYIPNQTLLFPSRIDEDIAANDPVRIVSALVDSLELSGIKALYKEYGRSPYHPQMMLKVILYAYMNNVYSCRKIEKLLLRDIHYIWLAGYEKPDFITINRFRNRVKKEINQVFTQLVLLLAGKGYVSLDVEYIDGTKIESKANKYTFVWRKSVEKNRAKLLSKINVLLEQIDEVIAQDKASENESVEFTPEAIISLADELKAALATEPAGNTKEEKKVRRIREKQVKELEKHAEKLAEYDNHLETMGERNSYSKTDKDATFMRMKEDAMKNGQTKPGYNLQIATENQFITDFALFPNPTDTLTLIPFLNSFRERYKRLPGITVADSGYGSEENYRFMDENNTEAFVKYNYFHREQRPRYQCNPFHQDSLYYNAGQDYYVCPMGQHMNRIGIKRDKTASGYITESIRYQATRCQGCPLRSRCFKAQGNRIIEVNHRLNEYKRKARERLTSEEGVKLRGRRCIEPEAVFGQMKYNMAYRRFRHVGKEKVTMDFAFFAMAFNLKKMCAKMAKEALTSLDSMKNTLKKLYSGESIALNPVEREIGRKWAA